MKIFLMRHGNVFNPNKVIYSRLPGFPLSEKGKIEAEEAAKKLIDQGIEIIHTSPLERTQETAKIVANTIGFPTKNIVIDQNLNECEIYQKWSGKPIDEYYAAKNRFDSIETDDSMIMRMSKTFEEMRAQEKNSLIVSHMDTIMALVEYLEEKYHLEYHGGNIKTAQIIEIELGINQANIKLLN